MNHMKRIARATLITFALVTGACESDTGVLEISATGELGGLVYIDRNANERPDAQVDLPAAGVSVALLIPAGQQVIARTTTDATGTYLFRDIAVGRYRLDVESTSLGDSLRVSAMDSATITVVASDTTISTIALGFPQVPIAQVRTLPVGRRIIVQGMTLNAWTSFLDSTLHVADTSGVLRAVRVLPAAIVAGDTVRLLGTVVADNGVNTIGDVTVFRLGSGAVTRLPRDVTTGVAATANNGALDNDLARIQGGVVVNTQLLPNGERRIAVDDGSGIVDIIIEPTSEFAAVPTPTPGQLMNVTGLLVAREGRTSWQLKPRVTADVTFTFRRVTIAEARTTPIGRLVEIYGLALNAWVTFGDATVHIVDPTGSLRATNVTPANIFDGDSVRFVGRIAMSNGQVILNQVEPTILLTNRTLPTPPLLTTQVASTADGARLDAALVRIQNATIISTASSGGDFLVRVNDGSGLLEVVIDSQLGLANAQFQPGLRLNATGLLVPATGGATWQLKPRSQSDITITP